MIEKIESDVEIENLYKDGTNAPYAKIDPKFGFGYMGVLLVHKETQKVQCHLCGNWYRAIPQHAVKKHNVTVKEYRKAFGFSTCQPLC